MIVAPNPISVPDYSRHWYENGVTRPGECPHSTAPALVVPAPHSSFRRRPESRGAGTGKCRAGACPPLGRRRGLAESAVPIRCTKPQFRLFIPWCAGASRHERLVRKWSYGHSIATLKPTNPRNRLSRGGGNPRTNPARQNVSREIGNNLPKANVVRGLVPGWGRGEWRNRPCRFAVPTHNSNFSHLGVPAEAGMCDCSENRPLQQPLTCHSWHLLAIPAPHSSFRRRPESRRGGDGSPNATMGAQTLPATRTHSHPLIWPLKGPWRLRLFNRG